MHVSIHLPFCFGICVIDWIRYKWEQDRISWQTWGPFLISCLWFWQTWGMWIKDVTLGFVHTHPQSLCSFHQTSPCTWSAQLSPPPVKRNACNQEEPRISGLCDDLSKDGEVKKKPSGLHPLFSSETNLFGVSVSPPCIQALTCMHSPQQ